MASEIRIYRVPAIAPPLVRLTRGLGGAIRRSTVAIGDLKLGDVTTCEPSGCGAVYEGIEAKTGLAVFLHVRDADAVVRGKL